MIRGKHPVNVEFSPTRSVFHDGGYNYHRKHLHHRVYERRRNILIYSMLVFGIVVVSMLITLSLRH